MGRFKDLTGQRFGMLIVISRADNRGGHTAWNCKCDCGNDVVVVGHNLIRGTINLVDATGSKLLAKN